MGQTKKPKPKADEALLKAAKSGDLNAVHARIAAGADVNAGTRDEPAAIFAAIESGKIEVVTALLAANAKVNVIAYPTSGSSLKSTPLCFAIEKGNWAMAQALVKDGSDIALEPYNGENAAGFAAQQADKLYFTVYATDEERLGRKVTQEQKDQALADYGLWMQFIRDAIKNGIKVRDYWLWAAVSTRHAELSLLLISAGVNPNAKPFNSSALVRAIEFGLEEIAFALIKAGADVNLPAEIAPLLMAAKLNRVSIVSKLLDAGADINISGDVQIAEFRKPQPENKPSVAEGATALIIATHLGHFELVKLLVDRKANLDLGDRHGLTALAWALRLGKQDIAECLQKAGAQPPEFLEGSLSAALLATAKNGDVAKVEAILKRDVKVDEPVEDREGKHFALVSAAREGRLEIVQLLLRYRANVNVGACENWTENITPLMAASGKGHVEVIKALLAAGADLHAKDAGYESGGETPLHYAARGGHVLAIKTLLEAGAKINGKAKGGITPLKIAISKKQRDAVKALLEAGADPDAGPADGSGPMHSAAMEGDQEMVQLLLDYKASPLPRGKKSDFVLLGAAARKGSLEVVRLLLKAGAPLNAQGVLGDSALLSAALYGREEVVKELLNVGADPNIAGREGVTPLMAAVLQSREAIVPLLLEAKADVHAITTDGRTALKIAREKQNQKILSLIEAAIASTPAPEKTEKPVKPVSAKETASYENDEEGDSDEEFEPPDFSEAAAKPDFQALIQEVSKLCGVPSEKLSEPAGGYSFPVANPGAEKLLADHQQRLLQKGAYLFRYQRGIADKDHLALLPTTDWADVIRAFQTNGANYDLMPEDIVKWMLKLSDKHPFIITGVSWDWLEGRFQGPVKDSRKLASQMYKFCPDIVDQGIGSVKALAQQLEKDGNFFFWWD